MIRVGWRCAFVACAWLTACTDGSRAGNAGAMGSASMTGAAGSTAATGSTAMTGSTAATAGASGSVATTMGASGGSGASGGAGAVAAGSGGSAGAAGASAGAPAGAADAGGDDAAADYPPLAPCTAPSVSRLEVWEMQVVGGTQVPATGSPLRSVGNGYELVVTWTLAGVGGYGTANAPLNNMGQYTSGANPAQNAVDLSSAPGVFLEYAATGDTYMQIRTGTVPHGGDHFRATLPVTGTEVKTITLNFADFRRPGGTTPPGPDILKDVFSFTFVGGGTTTLTLRQVRVRGFVPPCN
jgi:hypothetical protein